MSVVTAPILVPRASERSARGGVGAGAGAGPVLGRRDLALALFVGALAVGVMFDAWRDIVRLGTAKEELSYVFLAPAIIAWIAWFRRGRLAGCPVRRGWVGLAVLAFGWLIFWYGYFTDPVLWRGGAVAVLTGAVVAILGLDAAVRMWPAFVAGVFLVPISPTGRYQIAIPLQDATAQVTQFVCDLFGIYVNRSGNLLSINGVDVTIAEACNGMRMVLTLFMVCYLVAFTSPLRGYQRALLLLVSPAFAIVANVIRLVPTVWMFGHASPAAAETFHAGAGWVMTVLAFVALMAGVRAVNWVVAAEAAE